MTMKLLTGVAAAALIAGGTLAYGQGRDAAPAGPQSSPAPQAAPAPQRNAPAEKIAPAPSGTTGQSMDRNVRPGADSQMKADDKAPKGAQAPAGNRQNAADKADKTGKTEMKADKADKADGKARTTTTETQRGDDKQRTGAQQDNKAGTSTTTQSGTSSSQTTGQGAAASRGSVNLSAEQKTKITTVIKQQNVRPATNVSFNINIGTRVPREQVVTYWKPLPATVVEVYPEWRGYYFILVNGQIVIIEPATYEIVYVMAA